MLFSPLGDDDSVKAIAIIGGGPAGAMAARGLACGVVKVTVFEEKLGWEKPCGGALPSKALRRYPFLLEASDAHQCVRDAEFVAANGKSVRFRLREPVAIYSRATLNRLLLRRAEEAGAEIVQERILAFNRVGSGWRLEGRQGTYRADYLVVAAGARSRLRRLLTEDFQARDFMLTFGYYVPGTDHLLRVQFLEDLEGYAWAFPRPNHLSVGICGKLGEECMPGLRERLHGFMKRFGYVATPAAIYSHLLPSLTVESWSNLRLTGQGWALVGDAAGLVDPLTGEGIYYAIRSGELLAESLLQESPEAYPERVRQEFGAKLELGARLSPLFYRGDFLGGAVTARMVEFAARSKTFMDLLQDLVAGEQSYPGLAARLYQGLVTSLVEIAAGLLKRAHAQMSLVSSQVQKTSDDGQRRAEVSLLSNPAPLVHLRAATDDRPQTSDTL